MNAREEKKREFLRRRQQQALRDPAEVIGGNYKLSGLTDESLAFRATASFVSLLRKHRLTLLVTREYEHLVMALNARGGRLRQSFLHLPHPAGLAVDRKNNRVYVAATRNPNAVVELVPVKNVPGGKKTPALLVPSRVKYYPGSIYLHDLAFIQEELYANSVGQNGIMKVNMSDPSVDPVCWMPECVKGRSEQNHIQLNSIAAGPTLAESYFTASTDSISRYKPGDLEFPVDRTGVVFSGKTGRTVAQGLTRPHSARMYKGKIWVDNSGYGEFGYIDSGNFLPVVKLPGWTRGLCFAGNVAFVGVSRIIKKYKVYAPGVNEKNPVCAVYAVDIRNGKILGSIIWKYGNQIFCIDTLPDAVTIGFPFTEVDGKPEPVRDLFYRYAGTEPDA